MPAPKARKLANLRIVQLPPLRSSVTHVRPAANRFA